MMSSLVECRRFKVAELSYADTMMELNCFFTGATHEDVRMFFDAFGETVTHDDVRFFLLRGHARRPLRSCVCLCA